MKRILIVFQKEAKTGRIKLVEDDPDAVEAMLKFLYTCDYSYSKDDGLSLHINVYALADKYDIPTFKTLAQSRFADEAAKQYRNPKFLIAVRDIYNKTGDKGLRDIAAEIVNRHVQTLFQTDESRQWIAEVPGLAADIAFLQLEWKSGRESESFEAGRIRLGPYRRKI